MARIAEIRPAEQPPRWSKHEFQIPIAAWLSGGDAFFVLRPQRGAELRFYSGEDGSLLDPVPVDPAAVLPYDEDAYAGLPRDEYVLDVGEPGTTGVAALLDAWSGYVWRPEANELLVMTYRPKPGSSPRRPAVEPRWVQLSS